MSEEIVKFFFPVELHFYDHVKRVIHVFLETLI